MRQEREKHAADMRQLTNQMENLKELLHTYEISLGRKDEVTSSNLKNEFLHGLRFPYWLLLRIAFAANHCLESNISPSLLYVLNFNDQVQMN